MRGFVASGFEPEFDDGCLVFGSRMETGLHRGTWRCWESWSGAACRNPSIAREAADHKEVKIPNGSMTVRFVRFVRNASLRAYSRHIDVYFHKRSVLYFLRVKAGL